MIWIGESNEADQNDSDESLISARNKDTWQPSRCSFLFYV